MGNIKTIHQKFLEQNDLTLTQTLYFGNPASNLESDVLILNEAIQFVLSTKWICERTLLKRIIRIIFNNF